MMNDSYIDEIKKSFPQIELPLTGAQLKRIEAAARMKPQEIYVEKSERILALEREMAVTRELYGRVNGLSDAWSMKNWVKFARYQVPYVNCPQLESPKDVIDNILAGAEQEVNSFVARMHCAANDLCQMLTFAYNELEAALEAEKRVLQAKTKLRNISFGISTAESFPVSFSRLLTPGKTGRRRQKLTCSLFLSMAFMSAK